MKTAQYSDAQIMGILKQAEGGVPVSERCREQPNTIRVDNGREYINGKLMEWAEKRGVRLDCI
jgi:transposase InsO family protein